jgi:hypothetical protein
VSLRFGPALLAVVWMACAHDGAGGGLARVGEVGPVAVEGRIRVIGNAPFTHPVIEPAEGPTLALTGPYRAEVARLAGATVRVTGRDGRREGAEAALDVTSYEILSVDGDVPLVGTLHRDPERWVIRGAGGREREVGFVSEDLAAYDGALIWVVLDRNGGVARYGILREPLE